MKAAKDALKHGEWELLFAGHPQAVARPVPFSVSTAKRLMLIAEHKILSNRAHAHGLAPSWVTFYELSKVPEPTLRTALAEGRVHPGAGRREDAMMLRAFAVLVTLALGLLAAPLAAETFSGSCQAISF